MADESDLNLSRREFISTVGGAATLSLTSSQGAAAGAGADYNIGLPLEQEWEFGFADSQGISGPAVNMGSVTDDTIYVSLDSTDYDPAKLVALNRKNHETRWEATTDRELSPPTVVDGQLFVTGGSELLAFDAGEQPNEPNWRQQVNYDILTMQTVYEDAVCFAGYNFETQTTNGQTRYDLEDGGIFAYTQDGERLWQDHGDHMSVPYYRDETLYQIEGRRFITEDELRVNAGRLIVRDPTSGEIQWESDDFNLRRIEPAGDLGEILAAAKDELYLLDMETGEMVSEITEFQSGGDLTSGNNHVFVNTGERLDARDVDSGAVTWSRSDLGVPYDLTYDGGLLFVGTEDAEFYALDAASGDVVWENSMFRGPGYERIHDGVLYTVSSNWIGAFSGQRGRALQALQEARSEGSLGGLVRPVADILGRDRLLDQAESAIDDQEYDAAQSAISSANRRQLAVEATAVALTGGTVYTGGRHAARVKLRYDLERGWLTFALHTQSGLGHSPG